MNVNIQPTKAGGKHYVAVNMDGEMSRHGPFTNKTEAEAMALVRASLEDATAWPRSAAP